MGQVWVETRGVGGPFSGEDPVVGMDDRGFAYGDGLFETVRVSQGVPLFLTRHIARLRAALAHMGFPPLPWDEAALAERCRRVIRDNANVEGVLRLVVTRGSGPRGFEPPAEVYPTLLIQVVQLQTPDVSETPNVWSGSGVSAIVAPWKIDPASPLCYVKHLSALDKVLARQRAREAGADEALFQNLNGCLTEGAASSLFVIIGGTVFTPAGGCGLLPGIARGLLLETARDLPFPIAEAELPVTALAQASEAFLTNVVMGVRPLVRVDGRALGSGQRGPATTVVSEHYRRLCVRALSPQPPARLPK